MESSVFAGVMVNYPLSTYTTITLSLLLSGIGFFMGGYYTGHAQFNEATSRGVRRLWTAVFVLIGLGAITFGLLKIFYSAVPLNTYADPFEVTLISIVGATMGGAVMLCVIIGLHERYTINVARSLSTIPIAAYLTTMGFIFHETLLPAGSNRGPDNGLFAFGIFEVVAILYLLFDIYGPRALRDRDPNALLMLTGFVLFLVAPLIYTLGSQPADSNSVLVDRAGLFIGFHFIGLFFVFLAALPSPQEDAAIEKVVNNAVKAGTLALPERASLTNGLSPAYGGQTNIAPVAATYTGFEDDRYRHDGYDNSVAGAYNNHVPPVLSRERH